MPPGSIRFEGLNIKQLRESNCSLQEFVDWLLGGHVHIILGHVHQGTESFGWNVEDIYRELQRLQKHPGFPSAEQLQCPVFTQDKIKYLRLLHDYTLPSYSIDVSEGRPQYDIESEIKQIMEVGREDGKVWQWILKAPFITNSMHFQKLSVSGASEAASYIMNHVMNNIYGYRPTCYEIPYVILQRKVISRKGEARLVFLSKWLADIMRSYLIVNLFVLINECTPV